MCLLRLSPSPGVARRMLLAGHIKPWKDSSAAERLDPRNGLTACPSHDVAFDTGMLTVAADLKIQIAQPLADAARWDHLTRQYYGRPPLLDTLLLRRRRTSQAQIPRLARREDLRRLIRTVFRRSCPHLNWARGESAHARLAQHRSPPHLPNAWYL
jgi:hypothetical protein